MEKKMENEMETGVILGISYFNLETIRAAGFCSFRLLPLPASGSQAEQFKNKYVYISADPWGRRPAGSLGSLTISSHLYFLPFCPHITRILVSPTHILSTFSTSPPSSLLPPSPPLARLPGHPPPPTPPPHPPLPASLAYPVHASPPPPSRHQPNQTNC